MTALLGKVLLLTGCTAWGLLAGSRLGERAACLEEFRQALAALSRELSFSLRPLWELMTQAAAGSRGPAAAFFRVCCARFAQGGRESWAESWQQALAEVPLPLTQADRRLLEEAGQVLGRYDGESQRQALAGLLACLEDRREEARREARRLFRVYGVLGITGGLFCLILL
ncbi:MAG TPA: stage III sporulation protein AB [Candidatus Evtepia faecigallinarum]|nr:stage III sporulation protein AB [Candidatus Evtepia faecigallinarum]